nr:hypothetical protein [Tanacetum cinerariifolium]
GCYIREIKALGDCEGTAETVRFMERMQLDDMDKCYRSLLLMREMEDTAREKTRMTALSICDELRRSVNSLDWEPQFIYYCERAKLDDIRLARQINALCDTLTNVIDERLTFVRELEMLAYKYLEGSLNSGPVKRISSLRSLRETWIIETIIRSIPKQIAGQKRALFADVPRGLSDSSLFFAAPVTVLWLGGGVTCI